MRGEAADGNVRPNGRGDHAGATVERAAHVGDFDTYER